MSQGPLDNTQLDSLEASFSAVLDSNRLGSFDDGGLRIVSVPGALRITVLQERLYGAVWDWCEQKGTPRRLTRNVIDLPIG